MPIITVTVNDSLTFSENLTTYKDVHLKEALSFNEIVGVAVTRKSSVEFWPRWIVASVAKHFDERRRGVPMFLEGDDHKEGRKTLFELRVDGPYIRIPSDDYYILNIEVNVLIDTMKDSKDIFAHYRNVGTVNQAFLTPIEVLKLGTGIDDDQSRLGCFVLVKSFDQREALRVTHFGQLDSTTPLMRSSIEGHFVMQLHGQN